MNNNGPATGLLIGGRRAKTARKYRSHCKICREPLYDDTPARWSAATPLGLCHEGCP